MGGKGCVCLTVQMQLTWLLGAGVGGLCGGGAGFFPYFPPLKPRYVLWSGVSYSPKNTVHGNTIVSIFRQ